MSMSEEEIAIIRGMLERGDINQRIVAYFGGAYNPARVAEIKRAMECRPADDDAPLTIRARHIQSAPESELPPIDYPSPYQLRKAGHAVWHARVALEHTREKIELALKALRDAEIDP